LALGLALRAILLKRGGRGTYKTIKSFWNSGDWLNHAGLRAENDPRGPEIGVFGVLDISGGQTWLPNK
jgi:hypothetical protein